MDGFTAHPESISSAARGVDELVSRVHEFHRTTDSTTNSLSGLHPWGLLRPLRDEFLSLAAEFKQHLDHMSDAIEGARKRLNNTAARYSATETALLRTLANTGKYGSGREVRQLNPASRFYKEHRTWNGFITSLPGVGGALGSSVLDSWRLIGDLTSDDKYNVGTDIAMLITDASMAFVRFRVDYVQIRVDPLGYLLRNGLPLPLGTFYWTKSLADWLTGDPIATGQAAYNFDSIAQGCRDLAADLTKALDRTLGETEGSAADVARERLTAMRDGISHTGDSADNIAALLQLISSLIADVEAIVRTMISELFIWAVLIWTSAGLLAAETFGASQVAATERIAAQSARTAKDVGGVLMLLRTFLRRISELMRRLRAQLRHIKEKSFAALLRSSPGKKFWESKYGGGSNTIERITEDAVKGRHARINNSHLFISMAHQSWRSAKNGALNKFGFHQYRTDPTGEPYPNGKRKIRILAYTLTDRNGKARSLKNPIGVVGATATTVLPIGRAGEYWHRAGDIPSGQVINREFDLWGAARRPGVAGSVPPEPPWPGTPTMEPTADRGPQE